MSYELKGNSTGRGSKVRWPLHLVGRVIQLSQLGRNAIKAFEEAVVEYNTTATTPIVLAPSYKDKFAGSVLWSLKQRFQKKLTAGDVEAVKIAKQFDLLRNTETQTITTADVGTLNA